MSENSQAGGRRVVAVGPMPPEKSAYALARYSRSPDSIRASLEWVRSRSSERFLESFYFQYGHASIADLGHCIFCFEGVSELAAIEIEDERLWDGQAKSSRYQDFSLGSVVVPDELRGMPLERTYLEAAGRLLQAYRQVREAVRGHLEELNPKPRGMPARAYARALTARACDDARYLLFGGIPTNVGQVSSIRTLEKQMRRMGVSEYGEVRSLAAEMHEACARPPAFGWDETPASEPIAPTLARHADPDLPRAAALDRVAAWARQNFPAGDSSPVRDVDLVVPEDPLDETVATWLYAVTDLPFRLILDEVSNWSRARRAEVLDVALEGRGRRDELMNPFRSGYRYAFDIVCDLGAYRDLHRHRRCQQVRQKFGDALGFDAPDWVGAAGVAGVFTAAVAAAREARGKVRAVSEEAGHYLLPFATRCRSLFKMDFAEAEYIARVRSGVKGHYSYRRIAWEMRERVSELDPELGRLMQATPPSEKDPLTR